jgi:hypothetical protein
MNTTCYQIKAGRIRTTDIPVDGLRLPISRRLDFRAPLAFAGVEDSAWESHTLTQVAEIATRLTPWTTWFCAPSIPGGADWIDTKGTAYVRQSSAWVLSSLSTIEAVRFALHEAMHLAEDWLTADELQVINDGMVSTLDLAAGDYNSYYASAIEVRANAFMHWAMTYWLRGKLPEYRRGMPADERVWTMIMRGDLGLRVARRGLIPADRMSEALRLRMAERGDGQRIVDAIRPVVTATVKGLKAAGEWILDAFRPDATTTG